MAKTREILINIADDHLFDPLAALGNSECAMWVARYARQNVMNHCDMQARRAGSPGPCLVCLAQAIVTNSDK